MNAKDLIVRIKAIFSREGETDLAKPIAELSQVQQQSAATSNEFTESVLQQLAATDKSTAKTKQASDALKGARKDMQDATEASFRLQAAVAGSREGFAGLARSSYLLGENVGALVGKVTLIGSAFAAGWNVGSMIREKWIDPLWDTKEKADLAGQAALDLANKLKETNAVKFASIITEMEKLFEATEKASREIEKTFSRQKELAAAQTAAAIAQKKTEPDSSDKSVDLAKLQKAQSMADARARVSETDAIAKETKRALDASRAKVDEARTVRDEAKTQHSQTAEHAGFSYHPASDEFLDATRQSRENMEEAEKEYQKVLAEETRMRALYKDKIADWIQAFQVATANVDETKANYLGELQGIDKSNKVDSKHPFGVVAEEFPAPPPSDQDRAVAALRERQAAEQADVSRTRNPANAGRYGSADEYQQVLAKEQADVARVQKAIEEVLGGNQAVLQNILSFMDQLKQQNLQLKEQIRRMPL